MTKLVKAIDLRDALQLCKFTMSFIVASKIFNFVAYYINGISAKLNKTCYKALQKITDCLLPQKP